MIGDPSNPRRLAVEKAQAEARQKAHVSRLIVRGRVWQQEQWR